MGNNFIIWVFVLGLVFQPVFGLAEDGSIVQSARGANANIEILPDLPFIENYPAKVYQSHNQIFSLTEDQRGIMIFGTGDGWLEFDGARFRSTNTTSGIYALALDHNGVVYLGMRHDPNVA